MKKSLKKQNIVKEPRYTASDIYVLEGLEPVRKRPGMYIGSTGSSGLHHLIWEVVDNAIDEAMAGYAKRVVIRLLPGRRVSVADDGRGIPIDLHKQTKKSALETVMTTLHAGAKFGGESYKVAGGLHGVGVSVVNALSSYLKAEVCKDGSLYEQEYERGTPTTKVKKSGKCSHNGTTVTFEPDQDIFGKKDLKAMPEFDWDTIISHLRQQAYLTAGTTIHIEDRRKKGEESSYSFYFKGGILSYIASLTRHFTPLHPTPFYVVKEYEGISVEVALQYVDDLQVREPQFEGQTKAKLGNGEARSAVESVFSSAFNAYLEEHPKDARAIIEKVILAAKARRAAKAAKETILRKGAFGGMTLPGKLADCQSRDASATELFIVEGDSAGGSAKQARSREFQAILPIKGKILNVERARLDKMLAFKEIRALIIALGAGIENEFDLAKLRYHKIIIMTDADIDGAHIRTLLLTFFYRYFLPVIEGGYLYIAEPPLYRVQKGKSVQYAFTEKQKDIIIKELSKIKTKLPSEEISQETAEEESIKGITIQRYKGLGEMNPDQLWETTMDPQTRHMRQVSIRDAKEADVVFDVLMGADVAPRKHFIQTHAKGVKNLDI